MARPNKHTTMQPKKDATRVVQASYSLLFTHSSFLRELLWRFIHGDELFQKHGDEELTFGKIYKQHIADDEEIALLVRTILNLVGLEDDIFGLVDDFLEARV